MLLQNRHGIFQQNIFNEEKILQFLQDFAISGVYSTLIAITSHSIEIFLKLLILHDLIKQISQLCGNLSILRTTKMR